MLVRTFRIDFITVDYSENVSTPKLHSGPSYRTFLLISENLGPKRKTETFKMIHKHN